jgi:hypothetical protein
MYVCAARTSLGCPSKTCRDHAHAILGSVSNVDIDRNNALQIKALGVIISTFETLPVHQYFPCAARAARIPRSQWKLFSESDSYK